MNRAELQSRVTVPLAINLSAALVMLGVSFDKSHGLTFYPSTIPTMVHAGIAALIACCALMFHRFRFAGLTLSCLALGTLLLSAARAEFPGGDDGGGLGWLVMVCGGSVICILVAVATGIAGACIQSSCSEDEMAPQHPSARPTNESNLPRKK